MGKTHLEADGAALIRVEGGEDVVSIGRGVCGEQDVISVTR